MGISFGFSRHSRDKARPTYDSFAASMLAKHAEDYVRATTKRKSSKNPDPLNWRILRKTTRGKYLILMVHYPGCTNYEGVKILVFSGYSLQDIKRQGHLDPHFADRRDIISPIARFRPTFGGWKMAIRMTEAMRE